MTTRRHVPLVHLTRLRSLAVAGAAVLLALELTARVHLFGAAGLDPRRVDSIRDFRETKFVRTSEHPELGFELEPNRAGFFKLARFRTNSQGLRDREYLLEKPKDTIRVAVMGSSFTLPAGVAIEDAFHSLLEERLSERFAPTRVEFINFAVGALHPRQVLALLELRALAYDPDLILFGVTRLSTPLLTAPGAARSASTARGPRPSTHPFWHSFLYKLVESRIRGAEVEREELAPRESDGEPSILDALADISRTRRIPIVIVRLEFDAESDPATARQIAVQTRSRGMYFLDTRERFRGIRPRDLWIYELDPHPNRVAHAIFADVIGEFLVANNLIRQAGG